MQLYGLKQLRIVREEKLDTKCLLAWSEDTLVLSFRGTASTRNAISDLQVSGHAHQVRWTLLRSSASWHTRTLQ